MHILINKKKYRLTSSLQLLSSLPLLSTTAFLFVLHCCHIIFYELNWLSSCRPTSRSQTYMHIPRFSSSAVFIFFFTRAASIIFFLGLSVILKLTRWESVHRKIVAYNIHDYYILQEILYLYIYPLLFFRFLIKIIC